MPRICWEPSRPPVAVKAIQPAVLIQPVTQLVMATYLRGETIAAQWYCPAEVGYAERNSARDAARQRLPIAAVTRPQMTELGPPEGRARVREAASAVHEFCTCQTGNRSV